MEIVNFPNQGYNQVAASGDCPHCGKASYFRPIATFSEPIINQQGHQAGQRIVTSGQCESCKNFILIIGSRPGQAGYALVTTYPLGRPNDHVPAEVPPAIAADFREALRCRWIDAHRAAVVMCRRAIQASVIELGAPDEKLVKQIDALFKAGKITEPLKDFAHEIRLVGNEGAHPDKDGLKDVGQKDADDIIEFTREYLHHVYVMPAKLNARRPPKPAATP